VLAGQIRRGTANPSPAVLWSSDLRRFTQMSDRLPGEATSLAFSTISSTCRRRRSWDWRRDSEIRRRRIARDLSVANPDEAARAAGNALRGAEALAALGVLRARATRVCQPPLEIVSLSTMARHLRATSERRPLRLHGDRPAVNLVSRIEAIAKSLDLPWWERQFLRRLWRTLTSLADIDCALHVPA